ncbi:MAG: hypothetical protein ABI672_13460 [Vicinamibacteria bacterium]
MAGFSRRLTWALVATFVCVSASPAQDQSLAGAAKREKARRAKVSKPVKVLTEEDGKEIATKGTGSLTALTSAAGSDTEVVQVSTEAPIEVRKAEWKKRADDLRARIASYEADITQKIADVEAFRSDIAPLSAQEAQDSLRIQKREQQIAEMNAEVEKQRANLAGARKAMADLETEARQNSIPAGWLR